MLLVRGRTHYFIAASIDSFYRTDTLLKRTKDQYFVHDFQQNNFMKCSCKHSPPDQQVEWVFVPGWIVPHDSKHTKNDLTIVKIMQTNTLQSSNNSVTTSIEIKHYNNNSINGLCLVCLCEVHRSVAPIQECVAILEFGSSFGNE